MGARANYLVVTFGNGLASVVPPLSGPSSSSSSSSSSFSSAAAQPPRFGLSEFQLTKEGMSPDHTGTSWTAAHLRRKSFDDLHALWLVLYKERNALLTHQTKVKRVRDPTQTRATAEKMHKVKKSMARIKAVLAERRKAFKASRGD